VKAKGVSYIMINGEDMVKSREKCSTELIKLKRFIEVKFY
jgi:hypothetical protein